MTDLEQWLTAQGLGQYAPQFADNDIDFEVLGDLTEADLEKLGVSLGHRRKLLRALEARRRESVGEAPAGAAKSSPVSADASNPERRQITVLFCDLVGSTELAHALDPEDASALIRRYQNACSGVVAGFDGYVAKFMGDGLLAYFGYPQANEDAAEQAVRSAFAIIGAVGDLRRPDGRRFAVRVGIATGTVVIGDMLGAGSARERAIVGDTPNLAARLQAMAGANEILVSARTRQLLGQRFEYDGLGERTLKGFAAPVPVWRVVREAAVETRFAATRAVSRAAFVGRGAESSLLLDRWRCATQGQGQAILIAGEAGMGKSRLADVLSEGLGDESHYDVTCQCSPYHTNSALHPVIRHLERAAGFASGDGDEIKLTKLEAMLDGLGGAGPAAKSLIADLLSLPTARYAALDMSIPQRKAALLSALVELLTRLAADKPVLLLLEDAHWIDPTTRELWTRLIDSVADKRLLALVTARPEFASPWTGRAHVSSIELARLTSAQAGQLAAEIAAPRVLEPAIIDDIVTKSDGVPLYVEELTRTVLESSTPERPVVPATLHDSLMARLDRLGPAKDIAQVAAVIGQQFSRELLGAVVPYGGDELAAVLQRLVDAGLAYRSGRPREEMYSFKHALLRDVAYENLLRARRQQLHERIGRVLVENFASIAESEPELVAHHFQYAGLHDLACTYRELAGDRAAARSSFAEAIAHFHAALAEAELLAEGQDRMRRELSVLIKMGPPLGWFKGYHSEEAADAGRRAKERAVALDDDDALFKATWAQWVNTIQRRRLDLARDRAEELIALARRSGKEDFLLEGIHCGWSTAQFRGDVPLSLELSRDGVDRYDAARHSWMGPVFGGHDPGVCAYCVNAIACALVGRHTEAGARLEEAISLANRLKHPGSLVHAVINGTVTSQLAGDLTAVGRNVHQLIELADRYNLPPPRAHAAFLLGWERAVGLDLDAGLAMMESEFPRAAQMGPFFRYYGALLADCRQKSGKVSEALALLREMIATITEDGVGFYISELYRLQGVCLLRADISNANAAMDSLRTGVDIARRQGATLLELSGTVSLARAAIEAGRPAEGLIPLREFCASLPAEFDPSKLREANELLAGMAA